MRRTFPLAISFLLLIFSQTLQAAGLTPPVGYRPGKKIASLFNTKCAACHGEDGRAKTELGLEMGMADMTTAAFWKDLTAESARKSVLNGINRTLRGKEQQMSAFRDRLTSEQVDALVLYAASLKK